MKQVTTIGLDIAKSIFQVHGVDAAGHMVLRQKLSRSRVLEFFAKLPRCLVGIEACGPTCVRDGVATVPPTSEPLAV
jgi:transposase